MNQTRRDFLTTTAFAAMGAWRAFRLRREAVLPRNVQKDEETSLAWTLKDELMRRGKVYYAKLARGKATEHVRIAVYGNSNMTMDYMTGAMRRLLQSKFGDGGHGYVAMARPLAW